MTCAIGTDCSSGRLRLGMCERHYRRFKAHGHTDAPQFRDNLSNFWIVEDGCWLWLGGAWPNGYGKTSVPVAGTQLAHRAFYMSLAGEIPGDLDLDHLCRQRLCVNPDHLEPVTRSENIRRGHKARNVCKNGHDLLVPGGLRPGTNQCRECYLAKCRRVNARRRPVKAR